MADADFAATATSTIPETFGSLKMVRGTWKSGTNGTGYHGAITTGLREVHIMSLERKKSAATDSSNAKDSWIVTALPAVGAVTVVGGTSQAGYWMAIGR